MAPQVETVATSFRRESRCRKEMSGGRAAQVVFVRKDQRVLLLAREDLDRLAQGYHLRGLGCQTRTGVDRWRDPPFIG